MKAPTKQNVFYLGADGQNQDDLMVWIESCHPEFLKDEGRYTLEVELKVTLLDNDAEEDIEEELVRRIHLKNSN